jgi:hypothetical protein
MSSHPLNTYSCLLGGFNVFSLTYRSLCLHEWASKSSFFIFHTSFYLISYICTLPTFIVDSTSTFCALDFYVMPFGVFLQIFILEFLNSIKDVLPLELHKLYSSWASIIRCLLSSFAIIYGFDSISCFKSLYLDEFSSKSLSIHLLQFLYFKFFFVHLVCIQLLVDAIFLFSF